MTDPDWLEALKIASESPDLDLATNGTLDEIRHALVVGRLVDSKGVDRKKAYMMASQIGIDTPEDVDWFFEGLGIR